MADCRFSLLPFYFCLVAASATKIPSSRNNLAVKLIETIKLALAAIWAHKLRSSLTLLGMVIGVASVVVVVSLIQGFNTYVDEKIAGIGSMSFSIYRFDFFKDFRNTDTIAAAQRRNKELTMDDFEFIHQRSQLIDKWGAKTMPQPRQVKRESVTLDGVPVSGTTANIADIDKIDVEDGRYFADTEDQQAARVAFLGADVVSKLFPTGGTVLGSEINIGGMPFTVIGVAVAKGTVFGQSQDNYINIPLKTFERVVGPLTGRRAVSFEGTSRTPELYNDTVEEARYLMRLRRRLSANEPDNFGLITPDAITGLRDRIFGPIFIVAIAVPAIALVVGGIVVMNIMLVSVTERTKEIGIRKALGAKQSDILKQFLVEAVSLGAIGGACGVIIAWAVGLVVSHFVIQTYLSMAAIATAVGVSGGVGVLAGIIPAWKAARLDPIEALRAD
ncbi:MAG: putative transport system permease protein [Acidobacteriota bacterium]|nr:putative transport system permease protein [Acidobacteriota bacterium]